MLNNFFKLNNGSIAKFNQNELENFVKNTHSVENVIFEPDELKNIKFKEITFKNTSFSKTRITNVGFINCEFVDCLFIGTELIQCEFHNCTFKTVNFFKVQISQTYINPNSFISCFQKVSRIDMANIAVSLFQQLIKNSKEQGQAEFTRIAEYQFEKWKDYLLFNQYKNGKPWKISFINFATKMPVRLLYKITLGYGLRLRNLVISFFVIFIIFLYINNIYWNDYQLILRDVGSMDFFNDNTSYYIANIFYTFECMTSLIDSQLQPTSNLGMILLSIQSIIGFIFISGLITILINRFLK